VRPQGGVEIDGQALRGDEHRRVDQRPHGDRGRRPWLRDAFRTSEA
jgi:hypothetical protein